jgi:short-subunit dehydrogenase
MKYVLITGASTGIGYSTVKYLAERGFFVIGSVRKSEDGERMESDIKENFKAVVFDVTDQTSIDNSLTEVEKTVGKNGLYALINNAGIAVAGPLQYLKTEDFAYQQDVNVTGLLRVTQAFLPLLGAGETKYNNNPGRIINIGSVSGLIASPLLGAYSASKFAVEAISDSLRRELLLYGVKVILLQPGPIKTPIWSKSADIDPDLLETEYAPFLRQTARQIERTEARALEPEVLAKLIHKCLTINKPKTRYVLTDRKLFFKLLPLIPDRWIDNIFHKSMKKTMEREAAKKITN